MNTKVKLLIAAGATAILVAPLAMQANAFGGKGGKHGQNFIERMDTDGDGAVSREEIDAKRAEKFAEFDVNKDGQLSADEFTALQEDRKRKRQEARFQRLDADGSDSVSADEFGSRTDKMFARFDKNEDGKLTSDELPKRGKGHHGKDD